ncbi:hypothetical protein C8F01DRAFT_1083579 [Mycena amicta]|nr:hypothetical protein C8F01DRAFT_1083579 [Mycena amicta]
MPSARPKSPSYALGAAILLETTSRRRQPSSHHAGLLGRFEGTGGCGRWMGRFPEALKCSRANWPLMMAERGKETCDDVELPWAILLDAKSKHVKLAEDSRNRVSQSSSLREASWKLDPVHSMMWPGCTTRSYKQLKQRESTKASDVPPTRRAWHSVLLRGSLKKYAKKKKEKNREVEPLVLNRVSEQYRHQSRSESSPVYAMQAVARYWREERDRLYSSSNSRSGEWVVILCVFVKASAVVLLRQPFRLCIRIRRIRVQRSVPRELFVVGEHELMVKARTINGLAPHRAKITDSVHRSAVAEPSDPRRRWVAQGESQLQQQMRRTVMPVVAFHGGQEQASIVTVQPTAWLKIKLRRNKD